MATINTAGISGFFGFGTLAVLWVFTFLIRRAGLPALRFVRPDSGQPDSVVPTAEPAHVGR
jgi:hypothetical protein